MLQSIDLSPGIIGEMFGGQESIRDFIAFPKNTSGRDMMIDSPANVDAAQLKELGLKLD